MLIQVERVEWLQVLAAIIGFILEIFKPIVVPIGQWLVVWVDFLMYFFPSETLWFYIIIFFILIVGGIIINIKWPGEQYVSIFDKKEEEEVKPEYKYDEDDEEEI